MRFKKDAKKDSSILDITPIVDTVFNLLIFFALSLNFVSAPGIRVRLPSSGAREVTREKKDLRVVVTPSQEVYLNERAVSLEALRDHLSKAAQIDRETQLLIQADERVPHGKVVEIMDLARGAGLSRLAIVTQPKRSRAER